jgi:hypothetical protein
MEKYSVDYKDLCNDMDAPKAYRLEDVKDKIERVAFDVVRFRDNEDTDMLWRIDERDDGPVIVALYDEAGSMTSESTDEKKWEALPDKSAGCLHVYYSGDPIVRLAASDLGIPADEVELAARWLPVKLAEDEDIQRFVMSKVHEASRKMLAEAHPELNKPPVPTKLAKMAQDVLGKAEGDVHSVEDIPDMGMPSHGTRDPELESIRERMLEQMIKAVMEFADLLRRQPSGVRESVIGILTMAEDPFIPISRPSEPMAGDMPEPPLMMAASLIRTADVMDIKDAVSYLRMALKMALRLADSAAQKLGYTIKPELSDAVNGLDVEQLLVGGADKPSLSKVASKLLSKYNLGDSEETHETK